MITNYNIEKMNFFEVMYYVQAKNLFKQLKRYIKKIVFSISSFFFYSFFLIFVVLFFVPVLFIGTYRIKKYATNFVGYEKDIYDPLKNEKCLFFGDLTKEQQEQIKSAWNGEKIPKKSNIQFDFSFKKGKWENTFPIWSDFVAYRVKPEENED